ncbi:MAG TPA: NUDIX domain-containing protein [Myxococcales bacterium]|nr:NUDIX domain-containing protein [Myxococcales bacterium]
MTSSDRALQGFTRPSVAVDCAVFGISEAQALEVLLVRREAQPYLRRWALPGSFLRLRDEADPGESLDEAARRTLEEEAGVRGAYLEQLYTFGEPRRDPRGRVISVAYYALVRSRDFVARAGRDASEASWLPIAALPHLAFDHDAILAAALARLTAKIRYAPIGFNLLPPAFTLSQLQGLYEAILRRPVDKRNFRKRVLAMGLLKEAGATTGGQGRPARLYRFDEAAYERAQRRGVDFEV